MGEINVVKSPEGISYEDYPILSTIVPCQIVGDSVSVFLSLTIILAIASPLLKTKERKKVPSYNLYLVFLAIPDMINSCSHIYRYANLEESIIPYNPYGGLSASTDSPEDKTNLSQHNGLPHVNNDIGISISNFCIPSVLWISTIILYELLRFLRDSKNRKHCKPPSLRRVITQAGVVYAMCSAWAVTMSFPVLLSTKPGFLSMFAVGIAIHLFPVGYMVWVCVRTCRERLLSYNIESGSCLMALVCYFGRIVVLNSCIGLLTIATVIAVILGWSSFFYIYNALYAILVWIGFGLALTKPDIKEGVFRIWTCGPCLDHNGNDDNLFMGVCNGNGDDLSSDSGDSTMRRDSESQNNTDEKGYEC